MRMRIKKLDLYEAFELASILSKYVDVKKLNPEQSALDFVDDIVQKISPQDFLHSVKMTTDKTEEDLMNMDGVDTLALFAQGLKENRIVTLLSFYDSLVKQ
jgi:hypothetical protein